MPRANQTAEPAAEDAAGILAELGQAFIAASGNRAKEKEALAEAERVLSKLDPKQYPDLADSPVIQKFVEQIGQQKADSNDPPGTIYNRNSIAQVKKPWTFNDLKSPPDGWREGDPLPPGHTQWVYEQIPSVTEKVRWNGLVWQFFADVPYTGPKCFWDQLVYQRQSMRVAREHAAFMFKTGGMPSDPTVVNQATHAVRASGTNVPGLPAGYQPGAGVPPSFFNAPDAGAGEEAPDNAPEDEAA